MKTVSTKTIRRNLHKRDLLGRAAAKKLRMRAETRVNRLLWAKQRRNRTAEEWKRVVFSDECKFSLKIDGRVCLEDHLYSVQAREHNREDNVAIFNDVLGLHKWQWVSSIVEDPKKMQECRLY